MIKIVRQAQRQEFKRIMARLDKIKAPNKILKVIEQATEFLHENDIAWDAVSIRCPEGYVQLSQRHPYRTRKDLSTAAKAAASMNGTVRLGRDGRALLKAAITRHADWPCVKETLGVDISSISVDDLIAIAQLLKIDERFIRMFVHGDYSPVQTDLPFEQDIQKVNGPTNEEDEEDE